MKIKISVKTTVILVALLCLACLSASPALASKAVFPDNTKLQPIPVYVHPNVSGNVDSHLVPAYQAPNIPVSTQQPVQNKISNNGNQGTSPDLLWPLIYGTA